MADFKRIVVATDFSDASTRALDYADDLAHRLGATLYIVHVVQNPLYQPWSAEAYVMDIGDIVEDWTRQAQDQLARLVATCRTRPIVACRTGRPVPEIIAFAEETEADLLVLGTHGHGALAQVVLGSVAERVVRHAPCPVLTVRARHAPGAEPVAVGGAERALAHNAGV
jgi:universal stress protein A